MYLERIVLGRKKKKRTVEGLNLTPWQIDTAKLICVKSQGRIVVVKSSRQIGKSTFGGQILLYYSLNWAMRTSAFLSPTLTQAREQYKSLVDGLGGNSLIIKNANASLLTIEFKNGSRILFKSAEQGDGLRGYTLSGILIIDEAAYIKDDILELVLPWTQKNNANILIMSTPRFKTGFFYRDYQIGIEGSNPNIKSIDWTKYDTSSFISEEQKETYRQIFTKTQYRSEIEGEFIDGEGNVFNNFHNCIKVPKPSSKLYGGIDWASGGDDWNVFTLFNEYGEMVFIDYWKNIDTNDTIQRVLKDYDKFKDKIKILSPELNGIGAPMTDMLRNKLSNIKILKPFTTTNKSKTAIITNLENAFETNDIGILNDDRLLSELSSYAMEFNPNTRTVTYNAPQGLHDDTVMATAIAYDTYKNSKIIGKYSFR